LTEDELRDYYRNSRAFLFAGEEDFGIVAAEAASAGIPVICFEKSGMAEIVEDGKTGILFHEQNPSSIMRAIQKERTSNFSKAYIQSHAQKFAEEIFIRKMQDTVEATVESYREQYGINDKEIS
jgi:glycosyltransferase involved in cell wall biosynthesis